MISVGIATLNVKMVNAFQQDGNVTAKTIVRKAKTKIQICVVSSTFHKNLGSVELKWHCIIVRDTVKILLLTRVFAAKSGIKQEIPNFSGCRLNCDPFIIDAFEKSDLPVQFTSIRLLAKSKSHTVN